MVLSCVFLVGCGQTAKDETIPVRIQFATWGGAEEIQVIREVVQAFETSHPGVQVEIIHIPDRYYQKLHILIAGGLMPDVVFTNSISFPVYARHHLFVDLAPYLKESKVLDEMDFYPSSLQVFYMTKEGGKKALGAIPRDISNVVVYYNKDVFWQAGVPLPSADWDWQTFTETAKALTLDRDGDGRLDRFGVSFNRHSSIFWMPFVWSAGGALFNSDQTGVALDQPSALAGLQFYADWPQTYHVAPRKTESGGTKMSEMFLHGKVAMLLDGRWRVPSLRKKATFQWDIAPLPRGPKGSISGLDASGYAMAASTRYPEAAWMLIEYLSSSMAIRRLTESGLMIPARQDVAESSVFLSPDQLPTHSRVFLDVIPSGMPTRSHPRWNELSEELNLALEPVWDGQQSPEEAMRKVKPKLERIMGVVTHE